MSEQYYLKRLARLIYPSDPTAKLSFMTEESRINIACDRIEAQQERIAELEKLVKGAYNIIGLALKYIETGPIRVVSFHQHKTLLDKLKELKESSK